MNSLQSSAMRDYWQFWSEDVRKTGCELYARLAGCIGADPNLRRLAAHARKGQPHANVLLGAVHFLLLRGADHPLKQFYPSVGGSTTAELEGAFPLFQDFVQRHRTDILRLIETRVTNTNEVGRSALLHASFRELVKEARSPLSLIEVGPSAGLNLIWDRYGVVYTREEGVVASHAPTSRLVLDCALRGSGQPPAGPRPSISRRIGLEMNPVDLSDEDDRDWLRALVWPTELDRLDRLNKAIGLFAEEPPEIRRGDALELLPDALAEVPRQETLCVYHTIVVYQFSREMREVLDSILVVAGLRRPVFRLAFEFDGSDYAISLSRYSDGARDDRLLAISHPHGRWLEWKA